MSRENPLHSILYHSSHVFDPLTGHYQSNWPLPLRAQICRVLNIINTIKTLS